jgi:membrane protein implicated in regulation of membrane protease activity
MPDARRGFSVPGGVIIPIAALAMSVWLLLGSTRTQAALGGAALLAGALLYGSYRIVSSRPPRVLEPALERNTK